MKKSRKGEEDDEEKPRQSKTVEDLTFFFHFFRGRVGVPSKFSASQRLSLFVGSRRGPSPIFSPPSHVREVVVVRLARVKKGGRADLSGRRGADSRVRPSCPPPHPGGREIKIKE